MAISPTREPIQCGFVIRSSYTGFPNIKVGLLRVRGLRIEVRNNISENEKHDDHDQEGEQRGLKSCDDDRDDILPRKT